VTRCLRRSGPRIRTVLELFREQGAIIKDQDSTYAAFHKRKINQQAVEMPTAWCAPKIAKTKIGNDCAHVVHKQCTSQTEAQFE
jgi:hypothetical protein